MVKIEDNQKQSNTTIIIRNPTITTFLNKNYVNNSEYDQNAVLRRDEFRKELDHFFSPPASYQNKTVDYSNVIAGIEFIKNTTNLVNLTNTASIIDNFDKENRAKVKKDISVHKNNINKMDEIHVLYTRKKSEHIKKLLENKSHRSRVNSVFELSSKMMFNSTINNNYRNARTGKVSLLGLFELTTQNGVRPEGVSEMYAAKLAVKHINNRNILPGYTLELLTNDTKVSFLVLS